MPTSAGLPEGQGRDASLGGFRQFAATAPTGDADMVSDVVNSHLVPLKNKLRLAGTIPFPKHFKRLTRFGMPVDTLGSPRSSCHHVPSCWAWNQSRYSSLGSGSKLVHFTGRPISQETQSGDREPSTSRLRDWKAPLVLVTLFASSPVGVGNNITCRSNDEVAQLPELKARFARPVESKAVGVGSICLTWTFNAGPWRSCWDGEPLFLESSTRGVAHILTCVAKDGPPPRLF
jgi:hypothetical protein